LRRIERPAPASCRVTAGSPANARSLQVRTAVAPARRIFFVALQKYIVGGLVAGSVKG
jgi:hypothetical protein